MEQHSSASTQAVVPMLAYENGSATMDWLAKAFGFVEQARMLSENGTLAHGEMLVGTGGRIMMATPSREYESPKTHRAHCDRARAWSDLPYVIDGLLVFVDDVDQHYETAREAGATILSEPADTGYGRTYRVEDIEGHRWMFLQRSDS